MSHRPSPAFFWLVLLIAMVILLFGIQHCHAQVIPATEIRMKWKATPASPTLVGTFKLYVNSTTGKLSCRGVAGVDCMPAGSAPGTVDWADILNKPSTFTPATHAHAAGDVTSGTFAIGLIPTGTTGSTVAFGNHNHDRVYAALAHAHVAADVTSGTFAIARIPTGTTSTTVALGNHNHDAFYAAIAHTHPFSDLTISAANISGLYTGSSPCYLNKDGTCSNPSGSGTVTSVGLTVPGVIFVSPVSGSPVTAAGTLALALNTQTANTLFAGPTSGGAATPTFRTLGDSDIPDTITASNYCALTGCSINGNLNIDNIIGRAAPLEIKGRTTGENIATIKTSAGTVVGQIDENGVLQSQNWKNITTDYTNATTSATSVTGIGWAVFNTRVVNGTCKIIYQASATTAGLKLSMTGPTMTRFFFAAQVATNVTTVRSDVVTALSTLTTGAAAGVATTNLYAEIAFAATPSANGTLQLQAASFGTGTLTIKAGSFCTLFS